MPKCATGTGYNITAIEIASLMKVLISSETDHCIFRPLEKRAAVSEHCIRLVSIGYQSSLKGIGLQ